MSDKPALVVKAAALRAAFQSGSDERMLDILIEQDFIGELCVALQGATDRTLTYSVPQIASLAERVGYVERQHG